MITRLRFPAAVAVLVLLCGALQAVAAPYAAHVMDARTGEVLHESNANTRLHPASLTKMMTLYIAFEAVRRGEMTMDSVVTVSRNAAGTPYAMGFTAGSKVKLRHLVRAAAIRSSNDAAVAIGEAISGSEEAFAERMNRTAKALGMTRTTFKNPHGLTQEGHLSTARDMSELGRRLFWDYPQYYNLFGRVSTPIPRGTIYNTNRKFLNAYEGADGIKTGYTNAAGFNLTASAERGSERIIASVFGASSVAARNVEMARLLDLGFEKAPTRAAIRKPALPSYGPQAPSAGGRITRDSGAVARSLRPVARPGAEPVVVSRSVVPEARAAIIAQETVTRLSSDGGRLWGVRVGRYVTEYDANKALIRVALSEVSALKGTDRRVVRTPRGWDARFVGLSREQAALACRKLGARGRTCETVGPTG